ncbi:MAG: MmgE/PrpD family protein [Chloroflexi bacterium]|nr:MmgE/PrpD family protein [Chloroflexota bacterium]
MDAAVGFAQLATRLTYEELPQVAIEATKRVILDILGTTLAGSAAEGAEGLAGLVQELGGKPESSIIAYGIRAPSPHAALVNGFMARSADYDDTHDTATIHSGCTVVSGAFAAAERKGAVSGKEFITSVAVAVDMICRMALSRRDGRWPGFVSAPVYGNLGAALASARIFGLTEEQTVSALGIAFGQAAGTLLGLRDGVMTKNLDVGCAARSGVFSALAAQRGITGSPNCMEGQMGLFNVYHGGKYDPTPLRDDLGKRFEVVNVGFKPYPCCRFNHTFVDLALSLSREHKIRPEDIEEVVGYVDQEPHMEFHPVEEKQNPRTITNAQFSIPYCVAVALIRGAVTLDDFTESAIEDPAVLALARKVFPKLDASYYRPKEVPPARMEIRTKTGVYSSYTEYPYGHTRKPMTRESLESKFRDCAAHAHRSFPGGDISKVIDMVNHLEEVDDVAEMIRLLS